MMKKSITVLIIMICGIFLFAWVLVSFSPEGSQVHQNNTGADHPVLEVALYPYLDDVNGDSHKATIALLKQRYHEQYPDDNLEIFISPEYSTYLSDGINLSSTFGPGGPDLFEVEQTVLDNIIDGGYIRPFSPDSADGKKVLEENLADVVDPYENLGIIDGKVYYIPTWLCAHYTFVHNPANNKPESGDFSSNGTLPDLYLSAYASTYGSDPDQLQAAVRDAVAGSPDPEAIDWLFTRLSACTGSFGENRCLNGYYSCEDEGTEDFGVGNTDRYVGYSEMLYWILKEHPVMYAEDLTISGTVYGKGTYPSLAWVDGFVINNNTDPKKIDQAIRFVDFYNSPEVKEIIALSLDTKGDFGRVPRYLLPASEDFYVLPNVSADRYYRQFYPVICNMTPFPTGGLRGNMDAVYCSVISALESKGMDVNSQMCKFSYLSDANSFA